MGDHKKDGGGVLPLGRTGALWGTFDAVYQKRPSRAPVDPFFFSYSHVGFSNSPQIAPILGYPPPLLRDHLPSSFSFFWIWPPRCSPIWGGCLTGANWGALQMTGNKSEIRKSTLGRGWGALGRSGAIVDIKGEFRRSNRLKLYLEYTGNGKRRRISAT